jgi:hypothetical protein
MVLRLTSEIATASRLGCERRGSTTRGSLPMIHKTDITSARYIVAPDEISWGSDHLRVDQRALEAVRDELDFSPS